MKCKKCDAEIEEGYLCIERGLFLCFNCQQEFPMSRCPHFHGEHKHIKVPGFQNKNIDYMQEVNRIYKDNGNKTL